MQPQINTDEFKGNKTGVLFAGFKIPSVFIRA